MFDLPFPMKSPDHKKVNVEVPQTKSVYTTEDFESLGFHDCYVHGIRWISSSYSLLLDLDYIVEWIESEGRYKFWLAPAELSFEYASEVKMSLDWTKLAMECQIQDVHKRDRRTTPNGSDDYNWEIEFARPYGSIDLWATGFELRIQAAPELREVQYLNHS